MSVTAPTIPGATSAAHNVAEHLGYLRAQLGLPDTFYDVADDAALLEAVATRYNDTRTALNTKYSATLGSAIADPSNTDVATVQAAIVALAKAVTPRIVP